MDGVGTGKAFICEFIRCSTLRIPGCESPCASTITTIQRLLHSEGASTWRSDTERRPGRGDTLQLPLANQKSLESHRSQRLARDLGVFSCCAGVAKTTRSNREDRFPCKDEFPQVRNDTLTMLKQSSPSVEAYKPTSFSFEHVAGFWSALATHKILHLRTRNLRSGRALSGYKSRCDKCHQPVARLSWDGLG